MFSIKSGMLAAAVLLVAPAIAQAGTVTAIFGSGNGSADWTLGTSTAEVQLALRAKERSTGVYNWDGVDTYSFQPGVGSGGVPHGIWNFEWSINSNANGGAGVNLSGLTYSLSMTSTTDASMTTFDPINVAYLDNSIGTNATLTGAGQEAAFGDTLGYAALIAGNNLAQNSWRPGHFLTNYDPTASGLYNFVLTASNSSGVVARTAITVNVVPLPSAVWLGLTMLGGIGLRRRLRKTNA